MRYLTIVVSFFVATIAMSVWHNRGAELETASTRTQVFAHCVVGVSGERYTAEQFMPCMRAGLYRAGVNRHHLRTLHAQAVAEDALADVDTARGNLSPWTDE